MEATTEAIGETPEAQAGESETSGGKRKRKGNPVKVSRLEKEVEPNAVDDPDAMPDAPVPPRRAGLRLERHYSTLKKSYEELKQRYDSLRAMVAGGRDSKKSATSRDSKTAARERIRMVVASDKDETEGSGDNEGAGNDEEEDDATMGDGTEIERSTEEEEEDELELYEVASTHSGREVTSEAKRDVRAHPERAVTRSEAIRRRGRPRKNAATPAAASAIRTTKRIPPDRTTNTASGAAPVGAERKERKDKGRRRSSLQPKERRRLWRQSRPLNKCEYCDYSTRDATCFKNHVSGHDPEARRFVCEICSKSFRCKRGIQNHRLSHDSPERLHHCSHCSFQTPHKLNWVQHLAVIHKVDPDGNPVVESISCPQCKFTCVANHQLKAHVLRKHTLDKPFKCEQCDYSTVIRHELETHVGIRHKNERRYMCDSCGFRSQTQGGLTRHKRTHTGAKPFKCHLCGICYADSGKLKTHLLRHTSDEKPFVCEVCGHSSRRRDNLRMHLKRIHNCNLEAIRGHRRFQQQLQSPPVVGSDDDNKEETEEDFVLRPEQLPERTVDARHYGAVSMLQQQQQHHHHHRRDLSAPYQHPPPSGLSPS